MVKIILDTDSLLTPRVELNLRLLSGKKPPYVLTATGDLAFLSDELLSESREVRVITIEPKDRSLAPILTCDLPFLEISPPTISESPTRDPGSVTRAYVYSLKFMTHPPLGTFSGSVLVTDPWDRNSVTPLNVYGQSLAPVRAAPSPLVMTIKGSGDQGSKALFRLHSKIPLEQVGIEPDDPEGNPLVIDRPENEKQGDGLFLVRVKPGRVAHENAYLFHFRDVPTGDRLGELKVVVLHKD